MRPTAAATFGSPPPRLRRRAPVATLLLFMISPPACSRTRRTNTSAGTAILALQRAA